MIPRVNIKEWGIYRWPRPDSDKFYIEGRIGVDYQDAVKATIVSPGQSEFSRLHDGDEVEVHGAIYVLVGDNQNRAA